jgi:hypothetical protein
MTPKGTHAMTATAEVANVYLTPLVDDVFAMIADDGFTTARHLADLHAVTDANVYLAEAVVAAAANDPAIPTGGPAWLALCNRLAEAVDERLRAEAGLVTLAERLDAALRVVTSDALVQVAEPPDDAYALCTTEDEVAALDVAAGALYVDLERFLADWLAAYDPATPYRVGDRVAAPDLGPGDVVKISGDLVVVAFDNGDLADFTADALERA